MSKACAHIPLSLRWRPEMRELSAASARSYSSSSCPAHPAPPGWLAPLMVQLASRFTASLPLHRFTALLLHGRPAGRRGTCRGTLSGGGGRRRTSQRWTGTAGRASSALPHRSTSRSGSRTFLKHSPEAGRRGGRWQGQARRRAAPAPRTTECNRDAGGRAPEVAARRSRDPQPIPAVPLALVPFSGEAPFGSHCRRARKGGPHSVNLAACPPLSGTAARRRHGARSGTKANPHLPLATAGTSAAATIGARRQPPLPGRDALLSGARRCRNTCVVSICKPRRSGRQRLPVSMFRCPARASSRR